jgi:hypothetical protein
MASQPTGQQLDEITRTVAEAFDQFEQPEQRQARWENAAWLAGRTVDRNALAVYMAVADAEQQVVADSWAASVAASDAEVRRLRAELDAEKSTHAFTLRQRNNRSKRLLHLRDLANAGDTEALYAAARDTLAASTHDHEHTASRPSV